MSVIYDHNADKAIERLLMGRRIVATGRLTLDDGTKVYVIPNQGGCACSAGDYDLTSLATVDNVITSVRVVAEKQGADYEETYSYRIYVVQIDGDDGNGWYGTGYQLVVRRP